MVDEESKGDSDLAEKAILSAHKVALYSTDSAERSQIIQWIGEVCIRSKSPSARYFAHALQKGGTAFEPLSKNASSAEKNLIKSILGNYDPKSDRKKFYKRK